MSSANSQVFLGLSFPTLHVLWITQHKEELPLLCHQTRILIGTILHPYFDLPWSSIPPSLYLSGRNVLDFHCFVCLDPTSPSTPTVSLSGSGDGHQTQPEPVTWPLPWSQWLLQEVGMLLKPIRVLPQELSHWRWEKGAPFPSDHCEDVSPEEIQIRTDFKGSLYHDMCSNMKPWCWLQLKSEFTRYFHNLFPWVILNIVLVKNVCFDP